MIKLIADLHTHSIASVHAYSSIRELLAAAGRRQLEWMAITDHGIAMKNEAPPLHYFVNLRVLPEVIDGIRLLKGVEANIYMDGRVDMPERVLAQLDLVVASFHPTCCKPGTCEEHTRAFLKIAENPHIDIIGHSGSQLYPYDYEKVLPAFKAAGQAVEINEGSFIARKGSYDNCKTIASLCKKLEVPIVVNSDAHAEFGVGDCPQSLAMLEEIDFPAELCLNSDSERLGTWLRQRKNSSQSE